jgi:hypothetical protein
VFRHLERYNDVLRRWAELFHSPAATCASVPALDLLAEDLRQATQTARSPSTPVTICWRNFSRFCIGKYQPFFESGKAAVVTPSLICFNKAKFST